MNAPASQNWTWNGSRYVCTAAVGTIVITKVFTASAPYSPSPGLQSLVVECIGGGGGGGDAASLNANFIVAGGGGGSGGYSRKTLAAAVVAGGVNVTIGAGGVPDGAGAATSFGALCVANGGAFGVGNNGVNVFGGGGAGGVPGIGDLAFAGASGDIGALQETVTPGTPLATNATGGLGGVLFGGNVSLDVGVGNYYVGASAYPNSGAGGTGACINQSTHNNTTVLGGSGGSGICIVTEYCWSDASDTGCGCGPTGGARVASQGQVGWGYDND